MLPSYPRQLAEMLIPYKYKPANVSLFLEKMSAEERDSPRNIILLDEYSFLKEHSSLLLRTRRTLRLLREWGASVLDLSNRAFDVKHKALQKLRGPRWFLATMVSASGAAMFPGNPVVGSITFLGGVLIAVTDP